MWGEVARVRAQVWRNCVCALQGRRLCGVCAIRRRLRPGVRVFPALTYTEALSYVKITAARLNLPRAFEWGTHCFRRGRADQAQSARATVRVASVWRAVPGIEGGRRAGFIPDGRMARDGGFRVLPRR